MTVDRFDPQAQDTRTITVTAAARAHLEYQVREHEQTAIRLGVKESGCNGYMYTLDYLDSPGPEDLIVPTEGDLALYVNRQDLHLVGGTTVDLVREGLNASLRFKNPNAESHCGCGESFSLAAGADADAV
jgi:iron-sulfur cluster assembly accessory protein